MRYAFSLVPLVPLLRPPFATALRNRAVGPRKPESAAFSRARRAVFRARGERREADSARRRCPLGPSLPYLRCGNARNHRSQAADRPGSQSTDRPCGDCGTTQLPLRPRALTSRRCSAHVAAAGLEGRRSLIFRQALARPLCGRGAARALTFRQRFAETARFLALRRAASPVLLSAREEGKERRRPARGEG